MNYYTIDSIFGEVTPLELDPHLRDRLLKRNREAEESLEKEKKRLSETEKEEKRAMVVYFNVK